MGLLMRYLSTVAAVVLTIYVVPGVSAPGGWQTVFLVALVWAAISLTIKPVLHLLALPITILTLGLFSLVINALLFWLLAWIVPGFVVSGFVPALLGSILLALFYWIIHTLVRPRHSA